jgi:hypothetical protein
MSIGETGPRHHDFREGRLTSGSSVGELSKSQNHSMPEHEHQLGGQPYPSLARSSSDWMSIKSQQPWPTLLRNPMPRSSTSAPLEPDSTSSTN